MASLVARQGNVPGWVAQGCPIRLSMGYGGWSRWRSIPLKEGGDEMAGIPGILLPQAWG